MVELKNVSFRYGMEESGNLHEASLDHVDLTAQDAVLLAGCVFVVGVWILELCGVRLW